MVLWFDDLMRLTKPRCVGILPRLLSPQAQALREFVCLMGRLQNEANDVWAYFLVFCVLMLKLMCLWMENRLTRRINAQVGVIVISHGD